MTKPRPTKGDFAGLSRAETIEKLRREIGALDLSEVADSRFRFFENHRFVFRYSNAHTEDAP